MSINYHLSKSLKEQHEMSFIHYRDKNILIYVFITDIPHINILTPPYLYESNKILRLSILEPKILTVNDCDIPNWDLSDADINIIYNILDNSWKSLIKEYNCNCFFGNNKIPENLPMPNYKELKQES